METSKVLLMAELPGLEAAKNAIDARIDEIKAQLGGVYIAPGERPPAVLDTGILGRDVLGRILRKRNLTPEQRDNRRRLIALARVKKAEKKAAEAAAKEAPRPVTPPPPVNTKGHNKRKVQ